MKAFKAVALAMPVLVIIQFFIGLYMHELFSGALHLHITLGVVLLALSHLPFLKSTGTGRKVSMVLTLLLGVQLLLGLMLLMTPFQGLDRIHEGVGGLVIIFSILEAYYVGVKS